MRLSAFLIPGVLAIAGVSHAAVGTVSITWDGCTGPVDKTTSVGAPYELFLTVTGHDEPHKAYDVRFIYSNASQQVPDAWRFDQDGCETPGYVTQNVTSISCPSFYQNGTGALQIKFVRFSPPSGPYAVTIMQVLLANAYAPVNAVDPATRYLLERVRFDLTEAVVGAGSPPATCGGFEQSICFKLSYASSLDLNGYEIPFKPDGVSTVRATFNGPSACTAVPARATTWGSIRSQYHN